MFASSQPLRSTVHKGAAPKQRPAVLLRALRLLCIVAAIFCAALLPLETGMLIAPGLATVPVIGKVLPTAWTGATSSATPVIVSVSNVPHTAVVGTTEAFSVQLADQPNAQLVYLLHYPDGREVRAMARADVHGYSSHTFRINGYKPHHFREVALIQVLSGNGTLLAFERFTIQQH